MLQSSIKLKFNLFFLIDRDNSNILQDRFYFCHNLILCEIQLWNLGSYFAAAIFVLGEYLDRGGLLRKRKKIATEMGDQ